MAKALTLSLFSSTCTVDHCGQGVVSGVQNAIKTQPVWRSSKSWCGLVARLYPVQTLHKKQRSCFYRHSALMSGRSAGDQQQAEGAIFISAHYFSCIHCSCVKTWNNFTLVTPRTECFIAFWPPLNPTCLYDLTVSNHYYMPPLPTYSLQSIPCVK